MANGSLFGTSGIRGDAEGLFTSQFCFDITQAFIQFLKNHDLLGPLAVGYDPRPSSPRIKDEILNGLGQAGVPLYDEGITPIPSMDWLAINTDVTAGIMVTGSHIDIELNGIKFYAHNEEISREDGDEIEHIYKTIKEKTSRVESSVTPTVEDRAKNLYGKMLLDLKKFDYPRWKVAVDCANGSQTVLMPSLLRSLGFEVVEVNCDTNATFIARDTDTDDKAGLEDLKKKVVEEGCAFGVAFDGDGDRVVFINELGEFVQGEYSCSLIAKDTDSEVIVTPVSASQLVEKLGKKVVRTKVGSPYVIAAMKENHARFGFEANGGAVSAEIMYTRDGGSTCMKMLNIFSQFKGSFSQMIGTLPKYYMFRTKVDYKWEQQQKILDTAKAEFNGIKVDETDGLKIWLSEDTWILFRSSQNAPEFRVSAESSEESKAKQLLEGGMKLVNNIVNG